MRILITGGLGFVGSAVAAAAIAAGHEVAILDDLSSGKRGVADRICAVASGAPRVHIGDIRDAVALDTALAYATDAVVHCAGLKSITQSVENPLEYYDVNVGGTAKLLKAMLLHGVQRIVFSSSATVYGRPVQLPIPENAPAGTALTNPYGRTKFAAELLLQDAASAHSMLEVTTLRYFNPIGAHPSGLLGEDPASEPANIFPLIAEAARGTRPYFVITGTDFPTRDGTGVRDYIHITDLAAGHIAALEHSTSGYRVFNLGTGIGTSVLELIKAYELAAGVHIQTKLGPRRSGDVASCYADPGKALRELEWAAIRTVADACRDSCAWQREVGGARVETTPSWQDGLPYGCGVSPQ